MRMISNVLKDGGTPNGGDIMMMRQGHNDSFNSSIDSRRNHQGQYNKRNFSQTDVPSYRGNNTSIDMKN